MYFTIWDFILLIIGIISIIFWYAIRKNNYFAQRGVIAAHHALPFLGHMKKIFLGKEHFLQTLYRIYNEHPNERFIGFYAFLTPTIIIKDLDLLKKITVKDFDHFIDHKVFMDEEADPLFGKNLFFLKGQKWRDMRIAMSPAYTGSKMKKMLPFVLECAEQMIEHFHNLAFIEKKSTGKNIIEVEMKDVFTRFTNDVIASTAFGMKVNSLKDKTNEFYLMGKKATDFSGVQFLKFFGYSSCPRLMKLFGISLFPKNVKQFFRTIVRDEMMNREKLNCIRQDMIHLLMLAKKGSLTYEPDSVVDDSYFSTYRESSVKEDIPKRDWSHDDLTAQAVAFLLAGFDTSSSLLCFTAYELAINPDIQVRLQNEIDASVSSDELLSYGHLQNMKYLDMVISESLRMWPPDSQLERVCSKTYNLPLQNDATTITYQMRVNDDIFIPIYSIHHDAKYHPEPNKFNPERFSDENKISMHPFSFIPFGVGPRICIGARFAVMEAKVMIFHLLKHFDIVVTSKTTVPLKLAANTFTMHSADGFQLGLKLRHNLD